MNPNEPTKPWVLTPNDLRWLRTIRIAPGDELRGPAYEVNRLLTSRFIEDQAKKQLNGGTDGSSNTAAA